jgi:hypothetical protein
MWKLGGFVVAIGVAAMVLAAGTWTPAPAAAGLPDASCDQAADSSRIITPDAQDGVEQACRIRPECDSDDDCDGICGPGLGNCIHNKCPIRICRCG